MRPSPPLKLKPASTAREVQIAAVALKAGYLSAYRVVRDEPRWVGHKEPAWVPCRSSHYEVRLYEHVADRAYQVLERVEGHGQAGRDLALKHYHQHRERLLEELQLRDKVRAAASPQSLPPLTQLEAAALAAAEPNDAELGAKVRLKLYAKKCTHGVASWSYDKAADAYWCEACGAYLADDFAVAELRRVAAPGVAPRLPERDSSLAVTAPSTPRGHDLDCGRFVCASLHDHGLCKHAPPCVCSCGLDDAAARIEQALAAHEGGSR